MDEYYQPEANSSQPINPSHPARNQTANAAETDPWLVKRQREHYRDKLYPKLTQHGAMDHSTPPTDLDKVRMYRLGRVRKMLKEWDYAGILLYDQLNTRYATDATNMQLWCSHNEARYVLILTEGPTILFDYGGKDILSHGLPTIDMVHSPRDCYYMHSGNQQERDSALWIGEMDSLLRQYGGGNRRLAVDRCGPLLIQKLIGAGYEIKDGFALMEEARKIKSPEEIELMRYSVKTCENAIGYMREYMEPGITENALWAKLYEANLAQGGEWIETRLLTSGIRTNPWFQECSMREIQKGDMVSFDTDMVGPYGYCADISRSFICGDKGTDAQRYLYEEAVKQIDHNRALLRPGISFGEISHSVRIPPPEFRYVRYGVAMHGIGLCDEWPAIFYADDYDVRGFEGEMEPGMCICVEALVGLRGEGEAVKLEQQVVITETGYEQLSSYPLEEHLL